jgi:hypothetical protein
MQIGNGARDMSTAMPTKYDASGEWRQVRKRDCHDLLRRSQSILTVGMIWLHQILSPAIRCNQTNATRQAKTRLKRFRLKPPDEDASVPRRP